MNIIVDITHPAHMHFFRNAIHCWQAAGHQVLITSRDKDITVALLDEFGFKHQVIGRARKGILGLGIELIYRGWRLNQAIRQFKPDVGVAVAGTFLVYGALPSRIPVIVFYDTEHANVSNMITYPLAKAVVTPQAYRREIGPKNIRYKGFQELAYTHPDRFSPDPSVLAVENLQLGERFSIVRLVNWNASHDVNDYGVRDMREVVDTLSRYGRVILSSEAALPPDLQMLTLKGPRKNMLHLQSFASLLFGESATMASECAMLGTPAIFLSTSRRGYITELQEQYDIVYAFHDPVSGQRDALAKAVCLLEDPHTPTVWQAKRRAMLAELTDVTRFIVDTVCTFGTRSP